MAVHTVGRETVDGLLARAGIAPARIAGGRR